jgi:methionyl-tRNA formyltransferase
MDKDSSTIPPIVFMGTPEFALPSLRFLARHYPVIGVITQPDRPAGRKKTMTPPPIKLLALELGIPTIQPIRLKDNEAQEQLSKWQPDLIVVAAFGQILKTEILTLPKYGCINVHASLLPRWRGAAPISAAILNGDDKSGVTIMLMDAGIDTGPILAQEAVDISPTDDRISLEKTLAQVGADLLIKTIPQFISGEIMPRAQKNEEATYSKMLTKEDGHINFNSTVIQIERMVRAYNPWPGTFTLWNNNRLNIFKVSTKELEHIEEYYPGKAIVYNQMPAVICSNGMLVLDEVQLAGKNIVPGQAFLTGARNWEDGILS